MTPDIAVHSPTETLTVFHAIPHLDGFDPVSACDPDNQTGFRAVHLGEIFANHRLVLKIRRR